MLMMVFVYNTANCRILSNRAVVLKDTQMPFCEFRDRPAVESTFRADKYQCAP